MKLIERPLTIMETLQLVGRILKNTIDDLSRVRTHKAVEFVEDDKFVLDDSNCPNIEDECCARPYVSGKVTSINCRKRK